MEAQRWIERFELVCIYVSSHTKKSDETIGFFFNKTMFMIG